MISFNLMSLLFYFILNRQILFIVERVKETPTTRRKEQRKYNKAPTKATSLNTENHEAEVYTGLPKNKTKPRKKPRHTKVSQPKEYPCLTTNNP